MTTKFELLNALKGVTKNSDELIHQLRVQARELISKNNALVEKIWDLEKILPKSQDNVSNSSFMKQRETLVNEITIEAYNKKIKELLEKIKMLELETYGHSDIGPSPFNL